MAVLQPTLLGELVPLLAPSFAAGAALLAFAFWRDRETRPTEAADDSTTTHHALHNEPTTMLDGAFQCGAGDWARGR